uniref:Uncharacterized protein LOC104212205 n=1 Tax=Nicotiana sylvestris TaxID=4096 RepID=A0A1U7VBQ0_NICSY|nr:PREDICTED: uncharacterized protein LOC104212205 [Nicotiana sylvestris]
MQIPREENAKANALANLASATEITNEENASVIHLFHSVLDQDKNEVNYNNLTCDWRNEIVNFLQYGILPEDKKKAQALRQKAARYCLNQGNIYRKMFGGPLARCLGPSQTEYVMREIHEGHCGNHAGGRSLKRELSDRYEKKRPETSSGKISYADLGCQRKWQLARGIPGVLWAYPTTAKTSTRETLFSLVYGAEALITVEIGESSTRYTQATEKSNEEEMQILQDWGLCTQESFPIHEGSQRRKVKSKMGRALQDSWYRRKRSIRA